MEIVIKDPLARYIAVKAREKGVSVEELLASLLADELDRDDRVKLYIDLHERLVAEAKDYMNKGDLIQAGEKLWGALCALLSAIAELRGWRHFSHRDYNDVVENLAAELGEPELSVMFASAERLHANYYHGFLRPETFKVHARAVMELMEKLRPLARA